ncbi:hypothetical protein DIPPA_27303 [Diplonema papillatum]|nr:hypothetical protein DIPPA_27303 [Diplonema papillatum]
MATTIDFTEPAETKGKEPLTDGSLHLLPCTINFNGTTDVEKFFRVSKRKRELDARDDEVVAYLRGKELLGCRVEVSEHYAASLVELSAPAEASNGGPKAGKPDETWKHDRGVKSFTHWARDTDPQIHALGIRKLVDEWPAVASALARPVTREDIEAELKAMEAPAKSGGAQEREQGSALATGEAQ